jgi:hypothetical protein
MLGAANASRKNKASPSTKAGTANLRPVARGVNSSLRIELATFVAGAKAVPDRIESMGFPKGYG